MQKRRSISMCLAAAAIMIAAPALAMLDSITVQKGTDVDLVFDQAVSSKTAKAGDIVKMHVANDVIVNGKTVVKAGTPVTATINKVEKRKHFGVNAKLQLTMSPVKTAFGGTLALEPKDKGKMVGGKKTGEAAAASGGGALLLGPIGLAGGYFVVGKPVNVKPGDKLVTTVMDDTVLTTK